MCLIDPLIFNFHHTGRLAWFIFEKSRIFRRLVSIRCVKTGSGDWSDLEYAHCSRWRKVVRGGFRDVMKVEPLYPFLDVRFSLELIDRFEDTIWEALFKVWYSPPLFYVLSQTKSWLPDFVTSFSFIVVDNWSWKHSFPIPCLVQISWMMRAHLPLPKVCQLTDQQYQLRKPKVAGLMYVTYLNLKIPHTVGPFFSWDYITTSRIFVGCVKLGSIIFRVSNDIGTQLVLNCCSYLHQNAHENYLIIAYVFYVLVVIQRFPENCFYLPYDLQCCIITVLIFFY